MSTWLPLSFSEEPRKDPGGKSPGHAQHKTSILQLNLTVDLGTSDLNQILVAQALHITANPLWNKDSIL